MATTTDTIPDPSTPPSRRRFLHRLLGRGAAVAGGVALGGALDATAADAATGDNLKLGQTTNTANLSTQLHVTPAPGSEPNVFGLAVGDDVVSLNVGTARGAVSGVANTQFAAGVSGYGFGTTEGVRGQSNTGIAVSGYTDGPAAAVSGYATWTAGIGVRGQGPANIGVSGEGGPFGGSFSGSSAAVRTKAGPGVHLLLEKGGTYTSGAKTAGAMQHATTGELVFCVTGGSPGTFRVLASAASAGSLHMINPVRVYDSRPESPPAGVTKGVLATGTSRDVDCKFNASGVPASATAVMVTLTVTGTSPGGFLKAWAKGATEPGTSVHNWDHESATAATTTTVRCGPSATITVKCGGAGASTHVLVDVIGYYR